MSLVGYRARNHPQQVLVHGPRVDVDERATPPELFAIFHERFGFTIDVCALAHNTKCDRYFSPDEDGLEQSWASERVWCNPPFSAIPPWVAKAADSGADLVVMLVPANRTEQIWWQRYVEPRRDRGGGLRVEFLPGRLRFLAPGATVIGPNQRPPFGCCLLIWGQE
jgi:phage N-6-adenine-methyltransferase